MEKGLGKALQAQSRIYSLIMIIQLSNFTSYFADLPTLESVLGIEHEAMLLLKLPQLCVHVKRATKVVLPLPMAILGQVAQTIKQLLRLFQQMAKLQNNFPIQFLGRRHYHHCRRCWASGDICAACTLMYHPDCSLHHIERSVECFVWV